MEQPTKAVKRSLRKLAALAYEEELRRALLPISQAFGQWRTGQLPSEELTEVIHGFHDGVARELWKKYRSGPLEFAVAQAIVTGVIERDTVPADVIEHCRGAMKFFGAASQTLRRDASNPTATASRTGQRHPPQVESQGDPSR